MQKSEGRLQSLLDTLRASSNGNANRLALRQLHDLASIWSNQLVTLSFKRQELSAQLDKAERERAIMEERRDLVVLDLILDWNAMRR